MTYSDIYCMYKINEVDYSKVDALAESMLASGFVGCPILVFNGQLLTGSHRKAALDKLYDETDIDVLNWDVAEDVTDIVEEAFVRFEQENGWVPDIDYSNIGWMLEGSWVEEYKDEIIEW